MLEAWCELLDGGRGGRLVVRGESMAPALRTGWCVGVRPLLPSRLRVGDVAVFLRESGLVAHRVVVTLGWGRRRILFERGDGSGRTRRLRPGAVVGRVDEVLDQTGRRVPSEIWRWDRTKRIAVFLSVLFPLLAAKVGSLLTGAARNRTTPMEIGPGQNQKGAERTGE